MLCVDHLVQSSKINKKSLCLPRRNASRIFTLISWILRNCSRGWSLPSSLSRTARACCLAASETLRLFRVLHSSINIAQSSTEQCICSVTAHHIGFVFLGGVHYGWFDIVQLTDFHLDYLSKTGACLVTVQMHVYLILVLMCWCQLCSKNTS